MFTLIYVNKQSIPLQVTHCSRSRLIELVKRLHIRPAFIRKNSQAVYIQDDKPETFLESLGAFVAMMVGLYGFLILLKILSV